MKKIIAGMYKNLSDKYSHFDILLLFLTCIAIRLVSICLIPLFSPDVYQYIIQESIIHNENFEIATHIVNGNGYSFAYGDGIIRPTSVMAPIYPLFLSVFLYLFKDVSRTFLIVTVIQSLIVSLSIFPIYAVSHDIFNKKVAIISCLLFIFYPIFIAQVFVIHQLTFEILCVCFIVYLLLRIKNNFSNKVAIYLGVLLGISILINPIFFSFLPFIAIWLYFTCADKPKRKIIRSFFVILILSLLIITPWSIRNYYALDGFVFVKGSGYALYRGNNQNYTETGIPYMVGPEIDHKKCYPYDHPFYDKKIRKIAIDYMINNPIITIKNSLRKLYYFWWFPKILPEQTPIIRRISYLPLLLLGILGIVISVKRFKEVSVLYIPLISFSCIHCIFLVLPRYRIPILPIFFIFSAYAMIYLLFRGDRRGNGIKRLKGE